MIYVLNSPSASGKTTIMEMAIRKNPNIEKLVTVTTRSPRPGEVDGIDYFFVTLEDFQKQKALGDVVEETVYAGVVYGIYDSEIQRIKNCGKDAIVILDTHGVSEMKRFYGADNVVSIFIYRDMDEVKKEIFARPVSEEEKIKRFDQAQTEALNISLADYIIRNTTTIEDAVEQLLSIIKENSAHEKEKIG